VAGSIPAPNRNGGQRHKAVARPQTYKGGEENEMNKKQAEEIVSLLSAEFQICPRVKYSKRATRGHYFPSSNTILIGPRCWRSTETTIIHEFAHALCDAQHGRIKAGRKTVWHGPAFARCLLDTISAWYGNNSTYPWNSEYKSLQAYGPKK